MMDATVAFGIFQILTILFGGGLGMPSAVPPTEQDVVAARVAPAECLAYTSWAGTAKPDPSSENHTEQLLAEPEIREFLDGGVDQFVGMIAMQVANDPRAKQGIDDAFKLIQLIQGKPGAVYLSDFELNGRNTPTIRGGGLIRVDDDAKAVGELLERLQDQVKEIARDGKVTSVQVAGHTIRSLALDDDVPTLSWGIVGKHLVFGIGDGSAEKLIGRMDGPAPKWLGEIHAKLPVPRVSTVSYVDVGRIIELIESISELEGSPEVPVFISRFGLDKMKTLTSVSGMDATGCVNRVLLTVDGPGTGLLEWMEAKPLKADDLGMIGRESPVAVALKLDPAEVYDLWIEILDTVEPREARSFKRGAEHFRQQVGVDVRGDLLQSIGDTWRIFAPPGSVDLHAGWTLVVDVRDHKKLVAAQEKLVNAYEEVLEKGPPVLPTLTSGRRSPADPEDKIFTLDFGQVGPPVTLSWCVTEQDLIVTLNNLEALKRVLGARKDQPSVAQTPEVKPAVVGDSRTLGLVYLDTKEVAEALLPAARMGLQMLAQQGGLPFPIDMNNLPSAEVVIDHLQPTIVVCRRTGDGVELESRQTFPGPNVAAVAPVGVAVSLPAMGAARASARRAHGMNRMKQIGLSLLIFESALKAFPAGYSADKDGKPLLSWRVHVLPFLEENDLYEQFHLDEPWDSEHNKKLIEKMPDVFRSPNSKAKPGMTNYLGVSGADGVFVRPRAGGKTGTSIREITDGTSRTVMVVEVPDKSAVIWTRPADFAPTEDNLKEGLFGLRPGGVAAGYADGRVRFLGNSTDREILKGLFTKSGGEGAWVD